MNDKIAQLIDATEKVSNQVKILLESEQGKRQALLQHDEEKINNYVQTQQAIVMKLDGLEKKRLAAQEESGFAGKTANQILQSIDDDLKEVVAPVFSELKTLTDELQLLNKISLDIANAELKFMTMATRQNREDINGIYTAGGKTGGFSASSSSFHEKI